MYAKDKSCKWIESWKSTSSAGVKDTDVTKTGWVSRHDISMLLWNQRAADNADDDSELLKLILSKCPQDDKWDTKNPYEAAMKDLKEKRYKFEKKDWSVHEDYKEDVTQQVLDLDKNRILYQICLYSE